MVERNSPPEIKPFFPDAIISPLAETWLCIIASVEIYPPAVTSALSINFETILLPANNLPLFFPEIPRLEEYRGMEKEIAELQSEIEKINQNVMVYARRLKNGEKLSLDKVQYLKNATAEKKIKEEKLASLNQKGFFRWYGLSIFMNGFCLHSITELNLFM